MKLRVLFILVLTQVFTLSAAIQDWKPGAFELLQPTERKPVRIAVLIMSPSDMFNRNEYLDCRWKLGKKAWEQYMNAVPNVDCYFLQNTKSREGTSEQAWIEGNTIYIGYDEDSRILLIKTIVALEKLLPNYTHFFRTNVNAFVNLNRLNEFAETHHQSMFTGPLWQQPCWYLLGYGLLFSADVATHIVNEYRRLEGSYIVSHHVPEDLALNSLATGVFPYYGHIGHVEGNPEFTCCPTLPVGVRQLMCGSSLTTTRLSMYGVQLAPAPSFEQAIDYCSGALPRAILYRIRGGFDLDKLAEVYEYLLNNIYPELPKFDLVEFAKSLPVIRDDNT